MMLLASAFKPSVNRATTGDIISGGLFPGFLFGSTSTDTKPVTANRALTISAFYNGVDQISNDLAKLPFQVYKRTETGRERDRNHPVDALISKDPSNLMTSFTWRKMMIQSAIIKGNGISVILRNGSGVPLELRYIDYGDVVKVFKYNGNIFYQITGYGVLMSEDIFHIQGFSDNGLLGSSVIHYAAQSMGISLNAQDFASKSYDNKAISTGVLETEKEIKATNKLLVANAFSNAMNKTSNFRTAVLDEGMTYKRISLTPAELQFIETQANGVIEIARWLNIAPQKLKDMSNASYSALEFIDISHYKDCISPYMVKFSGEADRKLFSPAERKTYYTNFNINALMSADAATRANYYSKAIMMGWMTQNEVRALEEMNGKGEEHDVLLTPVNAQSIEQINAKLKQLESNG